jgi:hypothetical protein
MPAFSFGDMDRRTRLMHALHGRWQAAGRPLHGRGYWLLRAYIMAHRLTYVSMWLHYARKAWRGVAKVTFKQTFNNGLKRTRRPSRQ